MDRDQNSFPNALVPSVYVCASLDCCFALNKKQRELIKWAMKQSTVQHKYVVIRSTFEFLKK